MLKEAIAEAKTIKETAIANAKAALEEAFTPQLTAMFAEKLNEMEGMEEEVSKEMTDENYSVDEDFNLEEILAELDEVSKEDEIKESSENMEELMLEEMSDEELEGLILKVLRQEIEAGNVEAGENFEEEETDMEDMEDMGDMEDMEDMEGEEEVEDTEEVELEELLAEIEEMEKEKEPLKEYVDDYITPLQALLAIGGPVAAVVGSFLYYKFKDKAKDVVAKAEAGDAAAKAELEKAKAEAEKAIPTIKEADATEMEETIAELRSELNEVNLLNLNEEESATNAIARLLRIGAKVEPKEEETAETPAIEAPAEEPAAEEEASPFSVKFKIENVNGPELAPTSNTTSSFSTSKNFW